MSGNPDAIRNVFVCCVFLVLAAPPVRKFEKL
jgi:hypothetical protein